jgi:hypothetical protein
MRNRADTLLTEATAEIVRQLHKLEGKSAKEISESLGVSIYAVRKCASGRSWRSVDATSLPTDAGPLSVYEVTLIQEGWTPEIVFLGDRQQCLAFAEECRNDTIGCEFRVRPTGRIIGFGMEA